MTTRREHIAEEMAAYGESLDDIVATTLPDKGWDTKLRYGRPGPCYEVWTAKRVYYSFYSRDEEQIDSVARHPPN